MICSLQISIVFLRLRNVKDKHFFMDAGTADHFQNGFQDPCYYHVGKCVVLKVTVAYVWEVK